MKTEFVIGAICAFVGGVLVEGVGIDLQLETIRATGSAIAITGGGFLLFFAFAYFFGRV